MSFARENFTPHYILWMYFYHILTFVLLHEKSNIITIVSKHGVIFPVAFSWESTSNCLHMQPSVVSLLAHTKI